LVLDHASALLSKTLHNGEEETFEAARDAFKKMFWEWHTWALKQPGNATWYGAEE
jgi:hypothetical protein